MKSIKRFLSMLLVLCMLVGMFPVSALAGKYTHPFTDVADSKWYANSVEYVYVNQLMNGITNTTFDPEGITTRGMVVTVLHRMEGKPSVSGKGFADIKSGAYYYSGVLWAQANGIVTGYDENTFGPNNTITREQIATIIYRYASYKGYNVSARGDLNTFTDAAKVSKFAREALSWAVGVGLINGMGDNTLAPGGSATRAQIATILMRLRQMFADKGYTVTFDLQIAGILGDADQHVYEVQKVAEGKKATQPEPPQPLFGKFTAWYTDPECKTRYNFSTAVTGDITLYAGWSFDSTDSDGDGLPDEMEIALKTDPSNPDSDGDGLNDYAEILLWIDPLKPDTNGNGVSDFYEDYDGDGLCNGEEADGGTDPRFKDTDLDGLTDYDEVKNYPSDPTLEDTDKDGAGDRWEIENGFDPTVRDSSFQVSVSSDPVSEANPVAASVSMTVYAKGAESLRVEPRGVIDHPLLSATIPGYMGSAYDFTCDSSFYGATLTFTYDTSLGTLGDDFQPRIYYFNEEKGTFEKLANQKVTDGCVTAPVYHFSTYILLNSKMINAVWEQQIRKPITDETGMTTGFDVVFVVDDSGSMAGDRTEIAKQAVQEFLMWMSPSDRAALVSFNEDGYVLCDLTHNHDDVDVALDQLKANGGTYMYNGFAAANNVFANSSSVIHNRVIIFLSDGEDSWYHLPLGYPSLFETINKNNITIFTVGIGDSTNTSILTQAASATGGQYFAASEADEIQNYFEVIDKENQKLVSDENEDGITDYFAELLYDGTLTLNNGSTMFAGVDFSQNADYDGDGKLNGHEIDIRYDKDTGIVWAFFNSDPTLPDTDWDGVIDSEDLWPLNPANMPENAIDGLVDDWKYEYENVVGRFDNHHIFTLVGYVLDKMCGTRDPLTICEQTIINYIANYGEGEQMLNESAEMQLRQDMYEALDQINGFCTNLGLSLKSLDGLWGDMRDVMSAVKNLDMDINIVIEKFNGFIAGVRNSGIDLPQLKFSALQLSDTAYDIFKDVASTSVSVTDIVSTTAITAMNINDTIITYNKIKANLATFENNLKFLENMRDFGDRDIVKQSANKVIEAMGQGFSDSMCDGITRDILNGGSQLVLKTLLSKNPYTAAIGAVFSIANAAFQISMRREMEIQLQYYNSMSDSLTELVGYHYGILSEDMCIDPIGQKMALDQYLVHLGQVRIVAEKACLKYYESDVDGNADLVATYRSSINQHISFVHDWLKQLGLGVHYSLK